MDIKNAFGTAYKRRFIALILGVLCTFVAVAKPPGGAGGQNGANQGSGASQAQGGPSAAGATPSAPSPQASTASFESQVLAFTALNEIAKAVATKVCGAVVSKLGTSDAATVKQTTLLIYDQTAFGTMLSYSAFVQNAGALIGAYKTISGSTPPGGGAVATAAGGGSSVSWSPVSDLTGLLQAVAVSANNETYGSVVIPDSAMAIAVTRELYSSANCKPLSIVYPPIFGPGSNSDVAPSIVQSTIGSVNDARQAAHDLVAHPLITATSTGSPASTTYFATALVDIDGLYDTFMNSLLQPNPNTGVLGSAAIVQGKTLSDLVHGVAGARTPAYILLATVLAAGGTVHDHKSFWTALGKGDHISYSGGAIVAVSLWQATTNPAELPPAPLYSDIVAVRSGYKDSGQITGR